MQLFLSLEDKLAATNDETKCSSYRRAIVAFLESQVGDEHTVLGADSEIGWTKNKGPEVTIATGTENSRLLTMHSGLSKTNSPENFVPSWSSKRPVLVIDSDGVDPDFILDYIGDVVSGEKMMIQDSIYMGHLERWLRYFSHPTPRYRGTFGIVVQHPNFEGGEFSGFRSVMTDKIRNIGERHTNVAFIERAGRKKSYKQARGKIANNYFVNREFMDKGGARKLFSMMEDEQCIFIRDPGPWVRHVTSHRGSRTEMSSSCYLSKKDRSLSTTNERQMKSLWAPSIWDSGRLEFTFRMFESPQ